MTVLLCPLCSQAQFDTLEALRGRLVQAATQNISCPICCEVLLGLDKFTIHLFGHSLPASKPSSPVKEENESKQRREASPASTVNMDDLSFLTSWETCWKQKKENTTVEERSHLENSSSSQCPQLVQELHLEIKPKQNYNLSETIKSDIQVNINSDPHSALRRTDINMSTLDISQENRTISPILLSHSASSHASPSLDVIGIENGAHKTLLQHQEDLKYINPLDIHKPTNINVHEKLYLEKKFVTRRESEILGSPNIDSSPSYFFDGDTNFLFTPSPKSEDSVDEQTRQSGEVRELSQYMAGLLRLEALPNQSFLPNGARLDQQKIQKCEERHEIDEEKDKKGRDHSIQHPEAVSCGKEMLGGQNSEELTRYLTRIFDQEDKMQSEVMINQQQIQYVTSRYPLESQNSNKINIKCKSTPFQHQNHKPTYELQNQFKSLEGHSSMPQKHKEQKHFQTKEESSAHSEDMDKDPLKIMAQLLQRNSEQEIPLAELGVKQEEKEAFTCQDCGKSFRMRGSLVVHERMAHGNKGVDALTESRNHRCSLCSKAFKKEQHLSQHMKTHDGKQWQCETCAKFFTTKYFLKKHQRLHTGEMPYCCETCGKTFTFQQSYHKHLLYHSADKPHECRECGRAFKELSTLHNHQRIHSGEKPFSCETCGKCFRQRVSYIVHQRIHTGVLPYQCTACCKKFRYKVSQRSHKCTSQPPGIVVRQPGDLIQRLIEQRRSLQCQQCH